MRKKVKIHKSGGRNYKRNTKRRMKNKKNKKSRRSSKRISKKRISKKMKGGSVADKLIELNKLKTDMKVKLREVFNIVEN